MPKDFIPPSFKRVQLSTNRTVNKKIHYNTVRNIAGYNDKDIDLRMEKLNKEWDTERFLEANASLIILITIFLGFTFNRNWFYLSALIAFYLLQHAIQGWCPPLPIIRKLGIRTMSEINNERMVLKYMRGDFKALTDDADQILKKIEDK